MKQTIASGLAATIAILGVITPAFAATTMVPLHASSTTKTTVANSGVTNPKTAPTSKKVLLVGSVTQNSGGTLSVLVKTDSYTVTVGTATIINKAGDIITLGNIKKGDKVRVRGSAMGTEVTASSIRDVSLQK